MFKFLNRLFSTQTPSKTASFRTTQQQTVTFGQHKVAYQINRRPANHRSSRIYLSVRNPLISVTAPSWISDQYIESFLKEKSDWILRHLEHQKQQQSCLKPSIFTPNSAVDYLGQSYILRAVPHGKINHATQIIQEQTIDIAYSIHFGDQPYESPQSEQQTQAFHLAVERVLQTQALKHFKQRVQFFIQHIQTQKLSNLQLLSAAPKISLTRAKARWGSCSTTGTIRLHWRLIHLSPNLIDYVVAHEVAHLAHMNHSPAFWQLVEKLIPDYKNRQKQLKQFAVLLAL